MPSWPADLSWSPKGDEILFILRRTYPIDVNVAQADGSGYRTVAKGGHASWSPDGSRIAVRGAGAFLTTIARDGSGQKIGGAEIHRRQPEGGNPREQEMPVVVLLVRKHTTGMEWS